MSKTRTYNKLHITLLQATFSNLKIPGSLESNLSILLGQSNNLNTFQSGNPFLKIMNFEILISLDFAFCKSRCPLKSDICRRTHRKKVDDVHRLWPTNLRPLNRFLDCSSRWANSAHTFLSWSSIVAILTTIFAVRLQQKIIHITERAPRRRQTVESKC